MARGQSRRRTVATAMLAPLLVILVASGGCEIAIGNEVPAFECVSGAAVCPGNEVCDLDTHQCVAPCSVTGCSGGLECDPGSNVCVVGEGGPVEASPDGDATTDTDADAMTLPDEAAPPAETAPTETGPCRGLTCPCSGDAACDSGICADSLTVTAGLYAAAGNQNFCTKPCCTSADCDAGTVCFATATGSTAGNFCVNPVWLGRAALGSAPGGSGCSVGRDCRSGLCAGTTCADVCCTTSGTNEPNQCATGTDCRFGNFPGATSFDKGYVALCGQGGSGANGSNCNQNSSCQSELCDSNVNGTCRNACRNTADCGGQGVSCAYVNLTSGGTGVIAACFPGAGSAAQGSACGSDTDCKSQFCDATSKECTDVCFADSDCTKSGWRCRPEQVQLQAGGTYSVLACGT